MGSSISPAPWRRWRVRTSRTATDTLKCGGQRVRDKNGRTPCQLTLEYTIEPASPAPERPYGTIRAASHSPMSSFQTSGFAAM